MELRIQESGFRIQAITNQDSGLRQNLKSKTPDNQDSGFRQNPKSKI
jgi:hypothetical protein